MSIITDQYHIRTELLYCIKTAGSLYVLSHVLYLIFYVLHSEIATLAEILTVSLANVSVIYISCYWARNKYISEAMSTFDGSKKTQRHAFLHIFAEKQRVQFEDIMGHRAGIEAFCQHLANEFGLESILFIIEVCQFKAKIHQQYKAFTKNIAFPAHSKSSVFSVSDILSVHWLPSDQRMINYSPYKIALYLYDKYIESSADLCVNISSTNRRSMYRCFKYLAQQLTYNVDVKESEQRIVVALYQLFDEAYQEIWHLIQTDTFTRFKSTDQYEKLIHILYPTQAKHALVEAKNKQKIENNILPDTQPQFKLMRSAPLTQHTKLAVNTIPSITCNSSEHKYDDEIQHKRLPQLIRAASDPIHTPESMANGAVINNYNVRLVAHTERHSYNPMLNINIPNKNKSSEPNIIDDITVPAAVLKSAADFWKHYVTPLSYTETLEIGMTLYLSMIATDRSMQQFFRKNRQSKQIEILSLRFLKMISWLIQALWERHNVKINSAMTKLGELHKKLDIKINHFSTMLKVFHETFECYFPVQYRLQEQYSFDYIFAYSAQLMMNESLSAKTKCKTYYKTLELKFNSEKKYNDCRCKIPANAKRLGNNYSMPVGNKNKLQVKNEVIASASCFAITDDRRETGKQSEKPMRAKRSVSASSLMKSNTLALKNVPSLSIKLMK